MVLGHDISTCERTGDVRIAEDISFDTMLLEKATLKGLKKAGFFKPSPIQLQGIPLGKCGFDLLLEAKSGTGKTAVFTVIALEKLNINNGLQTIILAPTREIASQISDVITEIGSRYKGLNVAVVMGGLPIKEDIAKFKERVHVVVGSPGRLRHLIQDKHIDVSSVRLFVLDEADKLMDQSFLPDVNYIFSQLPKQKQVIMSSATYSDKTKSFVSKYVQKAHCVRPNSSSILLGIAQKVVIVPHNSNIVKQTKYRFEELKKILNEKQFKQCLIFCNYQVRVGEIHRMLSKDKWPSEKLYGQQVQTDRLDALKTLQEYKCRILVSTDLAARGIDASNVDIVINFEPPFEWETYLHRIGRAGRYGSYGTAITILSEGKEVQKFRETLAHTNIPFDLRNLWDDDPFNLILNPENDSLEGSDVPVTEPIKQSQGNCKMSKDLLWKALTTGLLEQDETKPQISSYENLCHSFKAETEPSIESFADLMHSYTTDPRNTSEKDDSSVYRHVKVAKLPMDSFKFNDYNELSSNKNVNGHPNVSKSGDIRQFHPATNITNGDSIAKESEENESHLIKSAEKSLTLLHDQENKFNSIKVAGSPTINAELNNNDQDSDDKSHKTNIDNLELASTDAYSPNDIQQKETAKNYTNTEKQHYCVNIDESKSNDKPNKSHSQKNRYDSINYNKPEETQVDPIKQALIDAGLPTAFGKQRLYKTRIQRHLDCNIDLAVGKTKLMRIPKKSNKIQQKEEEVNRISSRNSFTKHKCSSKSDGETDQSDSCTETNSIEESTKVNGYATYASTFNKTYQQHHQKKNPNNKIEQSKSKQFDLWYNHVEQQTKYIQYALYVEELKKL